MYVVAHLSPVCLYFVVVAHTENRTRSAPTSPLHTPKGKQSRSEETVHEDAIESVQMRRQQKAASGQYEGRVASPGTVLHNGLDV